VRRTLIDRGRSAVPPPPPARATRATAANQLAGREGQLQAMDEDAEYEDLVDEEAHIAAKHTARTKKGCLCKNPKSVLTEMLAKTKANLKLEDPARVKLINEFYRERHARGNSHKDICFNHLQFLASKMGLKTRNANHKDLSDMLDGLYASKGKWGEIQSGEVTGILFTAPFRGTPQNTDLMSYRYWPAKVTVDIDSLTG
jgi:hypothetical protein